MELLTRFELVTSSLRAAKSITNEGQKGKTPLRKFTICEPLAGVKRTEVLWNKHKHIRLVIIGSITMDCRGGQADPMSEAFLQMAGVFSQLELSMIRSRVKSGMDRAREKGSAIGRPQITKDDIPTIFLRHYPAYKNKQLNLSEFARVCNLSRTTVYKYLELLDA